jgi:MIP family channel proteins
VASDVKAAVAEFVATFALILIGAGSTILYLNGVLDLTGTALASGLALAVMVSITAHVSGGMANPAVSVSLWVTGRLHGNRAAILIVAQVLGAVAGALVLRALAPAQAWEAAHGGTPTLVDGYAAAKGVLVEAITTFLLVFTVFGAAVDDRRPSGGTAGFTIGLVLAFGILAFGPYTGAAMNPARWFGPALASGDWSDAYVWIVGPLAGGIAAGTVYRSVFQRDEAAAAGSRGPQEADDGGPSRSDGAPSS